jgi:hypothetical protein
MRLGFPKRKIVEPPFMNRQPFSCQSLAEFSGSGGLHLFAENKGLFGEISGSSLPAGDMKAAPASRIVLRVKTYPRFME